MPGVYVVTDSSSDLVEDEIDDLPVEIVPLTIRFGTTEYTDRQDLSVSDFYATMAATEALPQTACPSPGAFEGAFSRAEEAGADAVVCVTLSAHLSNTYQSACTAAAEFSGRVPVQVIDSHSVSAGLGTVVLEGARAAADGVDLDGVVGVVREVVGRTHVLAALDTLENLKKGGRIGGAKAMLASVLAIKPLVDVSGGTVQEAGRARTRPKVLHLLAERILATEKADHVAVMHGEAKDLDQFLGLIAPRFPRSSIRVGLLGAVVGSHGGPGIIGVSWVGTA